MSTSATNLPSHFTSSHRTAESGPGREFNADDVVVLAVRSAIIDAARDGTVHRQRGDHNISMVGYRHVYGAAQDLAEVAVRTVREMLNHRLGDILGGSPNLAPPIAQSAITDTSDAAGMRRSKTAITGGGSPEATLAGPGLALDIEVVEETYSEFEWLRANAATLAQDDEGPEFSSVEFPARWSASYFTSLDRCTD